MDRDLISEFIQQQHPQRKSARPVDAKSTNQVERAADEQDDMMLMKFLPMKLMDDEVELLKVKEAQSISSLKSKFDANVKALWNDVDDPLTKPSTHKSFDDDGNASLVSSFASEKNSLGLFNFGAHQPRAEVDNLQMFGGKPSAMVPSPGATERFIKSGTNLQTSIWSDGEFGCEPESLIYKDVSSAHRQGHQRHVIHVSPLFFSFIFRSSITPAMPSTSK